LLEIVELHRIVNLFEVYHLDHLVVDKLEHEDDHVEKAIDHPDELLLILNRE
jgi:hypothetical protein